jgi:hypothetical protein
MIVRLLKKNNGNYDIVTRGGQKIHTDKPLEFCLGYMNNQLQGGFSEIRITI